MSPCVVGKICVGIPYMSKIGLCGHLYHLEARVSPMKYMRACLTIIVANMFEVRFYCLDATQTSKGDGSLLSQKWKLETTDKNDPEESGTIAILIKKDKVAVEFNNPIPPELMDAMNKMFKTSVKAISKTVLVVKNTVVQSVKAVGNAVASAASNAWRWCKGIFG